MATARDIVRGAVRDLGAIPSNQDLSADDAAYVLDHLNGMMHSWLINGLDYTHTTMTLDATFPLDDALHMGVRAMLAVEVAGHFGGDELITPSVARRARDGENAVNAVYWTDTKADFDGTLKNMPSQRRYGAEVDG